MQVTASKQGCVWQRILILEIIHYFVKGFSIPPVYTLIKKPQANNPVDQVYQVVYNVLFTKNIDRKLWNYIYPLGYILTSIAWAMLSSYHIILLLTHVQAVFGRYVLFNLMSIVDLRVITDIKVQQFYIDNYDEKGKWVKYGYCVDNLVYMDTTGIYCKIYYRKHGMHRITEDFTNGIVWV